MLFRSHHPFHLHLVDFQVLDRRPFDVKTFQKKGELHYTGEPQAPLPNELAWKDTVRATPGEVTRIIMRFGPFLGHYVYHCHILEHEDMDMMRPFDVVEPNRNTALGKVALARTGKPVQSSYTSLHSLGDGNSTLSMPGFFQLFSDPNRFSSPEKRGQKTCSIHGLRDRD